MLDALTPLAWLDGTDWSIKTAAEERELARDRESMGEGDVAGRWCGKSCGIYVCLSMCRITDAKSDSNITVTQVYPRYRKQLFFSLFHFLSQCYMYSSDSNVTAHVMSCCQSQQFISSCRLNFRSLHVELQAFVSMLQKSTSAGSTAGFWGCFQCCCTGPIQTSLPSVVSILHLLPELRLKSSAPSSLFN